ncbi:glycosyltransferase family 2 protein [Aquirufa sp. ROCK2-A2]
MKSPLFVTIIVPIYNVAAYLPKCLSSLVGQSYPHLEIILVNDGSSDNCLEICESFAKIDDRIVIINQENGGISSARNVALDIAKGAFIAFVDADDFIHTDFVSLSVAALLETKSQISFVNYKTFASDEIISENTYDLPNSEIVFSPQEVILNFYQTNNLNTFVTVNGKLYAQEIFEGLRFPVRQMFEDESINYLLAYRADKIVYLTKPLYFYLIRMGSESNKPFSLKNFKKHEVFEIRIDYFQHVKDSKLVNETMFAYLKLLISDSIKLKLHFPEEDVLFKILMDKYRKGYLKLLLSNISITRKFYILLLIPSFVQSKAFFKLRNLFFSFHVKFGRYFEQKTQIHP